MTDSSWSDDLIACAGQVERGDAERFRLIMAAPLAARERLLPLYAFNLEVARAPWVTQEPMIAEMRLQWWRDALEEIAAGGTVRRHEVVTPLAEVLPAEAAMLLDKLVEARRWDVWKEPFEDDAAFRAYMDATSGNLIRAGVMIMAERADPEVARGAGLAIGLANWFRAVPELEASKRFPLPDGRPETVQALAREGLASARVARARREHVPKAAAPVLFGLREAEAVLKLAAEAPERVKDGTLDVPPARRSFALARAAFTGRW